MIFTTIGTFGPDVTSYRRQAIGFVGSFAQVEALARHAPVLSG